MKRGRYYILIGALIAAGGVSMYGYAQRPSRVVANAVYKLSHAETQYFEASATLDDPAATQSLFQNAGALVVVLNGSFDRRGEERDSLVTDVAINAETEGVKIELTGELRLLDDKAYLLVKKSPTAIPLLAKLKDTWVELPRGEARNISTPATEGNFFHSLERAGREKIEGKSTVKYQASATQNAIVNFMGRVAELLGTQLTDAQVNTIQKNLSGAEELPVTFWITPVSHELVQLETRLGDTGTRYTIKFSKRNQPVNHTAPEGAKPIKEVLSANQPSN